MTVGAAVVEEYLRRSFPLWVVFVVDGCYAEVTWVATVVAGEAIFDVDEDCGSNSKMSSTLK